MATTINSGYGNSPKLTANIADHADVYGGRALVFDGVTDYLTCGTGLGNQLGNGYSKDTGLTASLWFKNDGTTDGGLFQIGSNLGAGEFSFQIDNNNDLYFLLNGNGWHRKVSFTDTSNWHHVVCIYGSSQDNSKIYLDGESVGAAGGSFPNTLDFSGLHTTIGNYWNLAYRFNGKITDVKVFNTELTEAQITELYKKPENTPNAVQDNLVAWYPMIESNPESPQSIVYDHSEKKLGSELVTGGDMSNLADAGTLGYAFIPPSNWTFKYSAGSNGSSTQFSVADNGGLRIFSNRTGVDYYTVGAQGTGVVTGKVYKLTFDAKTNDASKTNLGVRYSNGSNMAYGNGGLDVGVTLTTSFQTFTYYFSPFASNSADRAIHFGRHANTSVGHTNSVDATIDNVSVKEVLMGNHATTNFFGDELIENGGFESDGANWTNIGTPTTSEVNTTGTYVNSGSKSWKITTDGYQEGVMQDLGSDEYEEGKTYTVEAYVYLVDSITVELWINGNQIETTSTTGSFVRLAGTFVASGSNRTLTVRTISGSANGTYYIDDVSVKEVGISSSGFETAVNEPVVPQVPLMKYNQKAIFDRNKNTYVSLTEQTLEANTAFTIAFSFTPFKNGEQHIIGKNSTDDTIRVDSNGTNRIVIRINNDFGSMGGTGDVNANESHFCVITRTTGGVFSVYRNGVKSTASFTNTSDFKYQYLGQSLNGGWESDGLLDEFSIFNTHFSDAEAQELFNDGVALDATTHSKKDNLLGYWRNDGVTTWLDRGGIPEATFNGSSSFINCGGDIDVVGAFSISLWFNADSLSASARNFACQGNSFFGTGSSTGTLIYQGQGSGANNLVTQTVLSTGVWHHAVLTVSGTNAGNGAIYINGSRDDDGASTVFMSAGDFVIGKMPTASSRYYDGKMAQVAIFNRVLSASEVSDIYNLGRIGADISSYSGLQGYWFLDGSHSNPDNSGSDKVLDRSGNNNHGTLTDVVLTGNNDGTVQGSPDSITIREGLNSNRDGLGFYFTNPSSNVLRLNGVDEQIIVPDTDFNFSSQMTFECWAKNNSNDNTSNEFLIAQYDYNNNQRAFRAYIHSNGAFYCTVSASGGSTISQVYTTNAISNLDNWHHYAFTFSSGTFVVYVDGAVATITTGSVNASVTSIHNSTADIQIGSSYPPNSTGGEWNGLIDEVKIYNRALSADEITKNYKHQKGKHKND